MIKRFFSSKAFSIKAAFLLFFLFFISSFISPSLAKAGEVEIVTFWSKTCSHCAEEKVFLEKLKKEYPEIIIESLEISDPANVEKQVKMAAEFEVPEQYQKSVPLTFIGEEYFLGFRDEETTGQEIRRAVEVLLGVEKADDDFEKGSLKIPLLGRVNPKNLSLPVLTVVLGLLDGFNPCAMWTLLFLISMLLRVKDKKRRWVLGVAFIITSGLVYFLIMAAWLNLFLLLGFVFWVRVLVGLIALGAGVWSLRDWWRNKDGGCEVVEEEKRNRIFGKIKDIVTKKELVFALGGIVLLALAVNMIELVCSAGLPAIYTQVLALSDLPSWKHYSYLLLYILFFMIDDLFVFIIAMVTLNMVGIESKYARLSRLIGGILILLIGTLLLLKPEWLMFG